MSTAGYNDYMLELRCAFHTKNMQYYNKSTRYESVLITYCSDTNRVTSTVDKGVC